ncbi:MAG: DUF2079 domain-containing protein, partial [Methanosarcinales archaeon]
MNIKRKLQKLEVVLVFTFIALYSLAALLVSLHRYWQYNAFWYDFGIFDETVWKLSKFQLPIIPNLNPPLGRIVWADHFNPSIITLTPFYWITDKSEVILVAQVIFVALSAIVAYLIALKKVKNSLVRISLISSYLGFVGMQNALYTDVHNIVFALLPLMVTFWAIYQKNWKVFWFFLVLTFGFQENMTGVGLGLGLFLLLRKEKQKKVGVLTILISILYGALTTKVLIPFFRESSYAYIPEIPTVWHQWITRFFIPLEMKLKSIFLTFTTFGFLPLASFATIPLIVEHYLERFVLNTAATRWDLGFHYNALLSPIMFIASLEVICKIQNCIKLEKFLPIWAFTNILIVVFLHRFYLHGPLMLATHPVFYEQTMRAKFLDKFISQIPTNGLLMTQNNLATRFTHKNTILLNKNYEEIKPDIIAVDKRPGQNANNFFPITPDGFEAIIASLSANRNYLKKSITDSQFVF